MRKIVNDLATKSYSLSEENGVLKEKVKIFYNRGFIHLILIYPSVPTAGLRETNTVFTCLNLMNGSAWLPMIARF